MSAAWRIGAVAGLLLLIGCVGVPVHEGPAVPADLAAQRQGARETVLTAHPQWTLRGRAALSNGHDGGSGRVDWRQDGPRYVVALSAPITHQSWRMSGDAASARLEGLPSGARVGSDAEALLRDATGWVIPVSALASWVRGTADRGLPPAVLSYGPDGRLARLRQAGWTIDYSNWQPHPSLGIDLPARVDAIQGDARVRLVIDQWQDGSSGS
jgi:outer membrane lipoprotein LolB